MSDHFVRPDVAAFLAFLNAQPGPKTHEVTPDEAREMMRAMGQLAEEPLGDIAIARNITIPGLAGDIPARVFDARETRDAGPVMVFYHGGGFVIGDVDIYAPYCAEVARQLDMPVISIEYRLAPEAPFPAASDDCEAATRWVASSPEELGLDVTGIITSGDSAGGNLAIVTTMALRDKPADAPVIMQHPIYPVVSDHGEWQSMADFSEDHLLTADSMTWFTQNYAPDMATYQGAPLKFDQSGMPPTLVTTASLDPLRDQGIAYYEKLLADGVTAQHRSADGNIHGHITLRKAIPSSKDDVKANMDMLKNMLADVMASA